MNTKTIIKLALKEDMPKGDITTNALIPKNKIISARFVAKAAGVVCGLDIIGMVFKQLDKKIIFTKFAKDGQKVKSGQIIAKVTGQARAILTGERTALNFLQHLSGVATVTRMFVAQVGRNAKIYDTRKTTHLLRNLEKYAVRAGGGYNHRLNLSDMVLIKDNHLKTIKNLKLKIKNLPRNKMIEIEAASFGRVKEFLKLKPDIILLDNMDFELMKKCIKYIREHSKCEIEISGNVNLRTVGKIAHLQPDRISVGKITHSAHALDISLEF